MCNCGCEPDVKDEADKLRRKTVANGAAAAALAGIPATLNSAAHPHHALVWAVIAVQAVLVSNAVRLLYKRKQVLQGA